MRLPVSAAFIPVCMFTVMLAACSPADRDPTNEEQAVETAQSAVPYDVIEQWGLPNGGFGKAILIDTKYRNEPDMIELAKTLKRDTSGDRNAFVFVFDDRQAALNRKLAFSASLSPSDLAHHDKHMVGSYQRNIATGHHALHLSLEGLDGPSKQIDF